MPSLSQTVEWNSIRSLTHQKVAKKIADNITAKIPFLYYINKAGNKEYESGGFEYRFPVFTELTSAQSYTGTTVLSTVYPNPFTSAIYGRKQVTVPIGVTGTDLLRNSGSNPEAIVNYLAALVEASEESMKSALAGTTHGIMSANADGDTGITGLQTFLTDSTTTGTVGQLARATYTFWQHQSDTVATGFNTDGLQSMRTLYFACVRGDERPTLILTNEATFINLDRALTGTVSYNVPYTMAPATMPAGDVGFPTLNFRGTPVAFDSYCPANRAFFLNLKYFKLWVHGDRDMSIRDWVTPSDQDAMIARIFFAGNVICNNLSRQGLLQGLPDTWA